MKEKGRKQTKWRSQKIRGREKDRYEVILTTKGGKSTNNGPDGRKSLGDVHELNFNVCWTANKQMLAPVCL